MSLSAVSSGSLVVVGGTCATPPLTWARAAVSMVWSSWGFDMGGDPLSTDHHSSRRATPAIQRSRPDRPRPAGGGARRRLPRVASAHGGSQEAPHPEGEPGRSQTEPGLPAPGDPDRATGEDRDGRADAEQHDA